MSKQDTFPLDYQLESSFDGMMDQKRTYADTGSGFEGSEAENILFEDPRSYGDRRQSNNPNQIPPSGCRRKLERRKMVYLKGDNWWIKRNYNNNPE